MIRDLKICICKTFIEGLFSVVYDMSFEGEVSMDLNERMIGYKCVYHTYLIIS